MSINLVDHQTKILPRSVYKKLIGFAFKSHNLSKRSIECRSNFITKRLLKKFPYAEDRATALYFSSTYTYVQRAYYIHIQFLSINRKQSIHSTDCRFRLRERHVRRVRRSLPVKRPPPHTFFYSLYCQRVCISKHIGKCYGRRRVNPGATVRGRAPPTLVKCEKRQSSHRMRDDRVASGAVNCNPF